MASGLARRGFLSGGIGLGLASVGASSAFAQRDPATGRWINQNDGTARPKDAVIPRRKARTTRMFKSPPFGNADDARKNNVKVTFPNALANMTDAPGGLWIAEQKLSGPIAALYPGLPDPAEMAERAWLVDWNGKVLKTVTMPQGKNTGGMAYGDGCIWRATEYPGDEGIYQTDLNGKLIGSVRQIPLGPPNGGGGSHGAMWAEGKLWIVSNKLHGILKIDPKTWTPEQLIVSPGDYTRFHACAWDNGTIWQVAGNSSMSPAENRPVLLRYDVQTGDVVEIADFEPGSADPHGLTMHDGMLISCDAGNHPNWKIYEGPDSGWIFKIDLF